MVSAIQQQTEALRVLAEVVAHAVRTFRGPEAEQAD
jgi:hypothetical protein